MTRTQRLWLKTYGQVSIYLLSENSACLIGCPKNIEVNHVPNRNAGTPVEIALYRCRPRCRPRFRQDCAFFEFLLRRGSW